MTFTHEETGRKFAVDIKSTYRTSDTEVNGMTLGAFTGYFRKRDSNKNTRYPYSQYAGHLVLGVIYSKCDDVADERKQFTLEDLPKIPSVVKEFRFFAQPKYKERGVDTLRAHGKEIAELAEDEAGKAEEESE